MPVERTLALHEEQQERLLELRAAGEESEDEERWERLRQREEDRETLGAVARLLTESGFAQGADLSYAQMARFLTLIRALAPNPNLDSRLLRLPDEPAVLNRDLRDLLFGESGIAARLRGFLARRRAGAQTAMQLLCAVFPEQWPLVSPQSLRALELTPEQKRATIEIARQRFALPEEVIGTESVSNARVHLGVPDSDPILRLLGDVIALETVRNALSVKDYVELHRLLSRRPSLRSVKARRQFAPLLYSPLSENEHRGGLLHEPGRREYEFSETSVPPPDITGYSERELLTYLEKHISRQGFTYPPLTIRDYYISLQTKPFALLAGLSGTGKTRLTSLFAEALTGTATAQYRLVPVRPDWADSTSLLGYVNLLAGSGEGRFVSTPFLDFLRQADRPENAHRAFFVCLDEMNLARAEHYFAEVLSAMETTGRELLLPGGYVARLPSNLFIMGTLNLDEATYSLSRKVLDRANTLTFHEVNLEDNGFDDADTAEAKLPPEARQALFLYARANSVSAARNRLRALDSQGTDYAGKIIQTLMEVNALLEPRGMHFAYRVRDEILRYCANSFDRDGSGLLVPDRPDDREGNLRIALDLQMVQKVLPRLTGTREQMESPLRELLRWADRAGYSETGRRLARLLDHVLREGFVSFDMA